MSWVRSVLSMGLVILGALLLGVAAMVPIAGLVIGGAWVVDQLTDSVPAGIALGMGLFLVFTAIVCGTLNWALDKREARIRGRRSR